MRRRVRKLRLKGFEGEKLEDFKENKDKRSRIKDKWVKIKDKCTKIKEILTILAEILKNILVFN